jgi:hypothetical protein
VKPTTEEIKAKLKKITKDLEKIRKFIPDEQEELLCKGRIDALTWVLGEEAT